jgi:hypothetical protein
MHISFDALLTFGLGGDKSNAFTAAIVRHAHTPLVLQPLDIKTSFPV